MSKQTCMTAYKICNGASCENASDLAMAYEAVYDVLDDEAEEDADGCDIKDDDVVDDEYVEYFMQWKVEEEATSVM